jgi:hypothetical protein
MHLAALARTDGNAHAKPHAQGRASVPASAPTTSSPESGRISVFASAASGTPGRLPITPDVGPVARHLIWISVWNGHSRFSGRRRLAGVTVALARFRFALDSVAGGLCLLAYLGIGIFTHTI